jgi:hypothetical protein
MSIVLTCKRGHRWDRDDRAGAPSPQDRCPVCGSALVAEDVPDVLPVAVPAVPAGPPAMQWAGVQLGPSLPMSIFTSSETYNPSRIRAMALYCSDGRWGEAFDEFCQRRLLLPRYDRWAVPGGPAWVLPRDGRQEGQQVARAQLGFLIKAHELERLVLITHYGCAYYGDMLHQEPDACLPLQMEETRAARRVLLGWFPKLAIEAYLAMRCDRLLTFHSLDG